MNRNKNQAIKLSQLENKVFKKLEIYSNFNQTNK